jgi:hypothetical protein
VVRDTWSYTSTPPFVLMGVHGDNFAFSSISKPYRTGKHYQDVIRDGLMKLDFTWFK